jgi:lipoate-protein ligase A
MLRLEIDHLPGQESMLIFHALARLGIEALIIVSPSRPLISVGYFQDAEKEVDLEFCRSVGLPVMRREVGGGATYLDQNQIFYQVVLRQDNPLARRRIQDIYEWLSQAPVETYRRFGIKAGFRRVNDIVTDRGKKIAGEGGANIGPSMVFVGGILMDFDYETMSKALRVPDEKFRDKLYKTMRENLTTMREELGEIPPRVEIRRVLVEEFEKLLGPTIPAALTPEIKETMRALEEQFCSEAFLLKKTPKIATGIKIREGVDLHYGIHKAPGGLIRTVQEVQEERIRDITISGDFTFYPKEGLDGLERHLIAAHRESREILERVEEFYDTHEVDSPGVGAEDYVRAMDLSP